MNQRRADEEVIDRILGKVREHGVGSLTPGERRQLEDATRRRREEDQQWDQRTRT